MKKFAILTILFFIMPLVSGAGCKKVPATLDNLKHAIIGETTASAKYQAYAAKAKEEKLDKIAKLFEAASKSESIHAKMHTEVLEKMGVKMGKVNPQFTVKSTKENIQDAIKGETFEVETMYVDYKKKAVDEGNTDANRSFDLAWLTEKKHQALYKNALDAMDKKEMNNVSDMYYICPVCGNTFGKNAPGQCENCGEQMQSFIKI